MSAREAILKRIREALRAPAPHPAQHRPPSTAAAGAPEGLKVVREDGTLVSRPASSEFSQWLPRVGSSRDEQVALFCRNAHDLRAEVEICRDKGALVRALQRLAREEGWKKAASHEGALSTPAVASLSLPLLSTSSGYTPEALEGCDVGITECDALIAQTGSVLVTSQSAGGRALSVLPPHHVVLARCSQLVPDLAAGYAVLRNTYGEALPSLISFITGPSRTGDIERILVLGAHGPKRLTILCLDD